MSVKRVQITTDAALRARLLCAPATTARGLAERRPHPDPNPHALSFAGMGPCWSLCLQNLGKGPSVQERASPGPERGREWASPLRTS